MKKPNIIAGRVEIKPGALEQLRRLAIERSPANAVTAAVYGMQQLQLAGATHWEAIPIAHWYARTVFGRGSAEVTYSELIELWLEAGGE